MIYGWEGNRRSGVLMHHRLEWFIHLRSQGLRKGDEQPPPLRLHSSWGMALFTAAAAAAAATATTTWVSRYQKGKTILDLNEAAEIIAFIGFWDVVASAGPYAHNLHLTPDR